MTGKTWQMSATGLPHNGEAQLAEVRRADGSTAILFDGRSKKAGYPRGIAWSYNGGASFTDIRFADDLSAGTSCLASVLSLDQQPVVGAAAGANGSSLLFSHPSHTNRSAGVLLRSDDDAVRTRPTPPTGPKKVAPLTAALLQETWTEVSSATPENPSAMFAYSNLNSLPEEDSAKLSVGLTYETGDPGCTALSGACKIVYRSFEL